VFIDITNQSGSSSNLSLLAAALWFLKEEARSEPATNDALEEMFKWSKGNLWKLLKVAVLLGIVKKEIFKSFTSWACFLAVQIMIFMSHTSFGADILDIIMMFYTIREISTIEIPANEAARPFLIRDPLVRLISLWIATTVYSVYYLPLYAVSWLLGRLHQTLSWIIVKPASLAEHLSRQITDSLLWLGVRVFV
jgi:hypothetical protein